ncbi:hypothetical protein KDL29_12815 [bacterium]|nr:hypothetical protein [bacterium]
MEAVKLSLNLQNCEIPAGCANFGELVSYMEEQQIPQDEVITRIIIDGSDVSSERELELATEPLSEFEIVEFYSARTLDLARQSMQDATELLPALQADLPTVASELRGGNIQDGLLMFDKCLEIISHYVSLVNAIDGIYRRIDPSFRLLPSADAATDDNDTEFDVDSLNPNPDNELKTFASIENLRQKLMSVEQAQANGDSLLLADLIEFEILPIVGIWNNELPVLNGRVQRENAKA